MEALNTRMTGEYVLRSHPVKRQIDLLQSRKNIVQPV